MAARRPKSWLTAGTDAVNGGTDARAADSKTEASPLLVHRTELSNLKNSTERLRETDELADGLAGDKVMVEQSLEAVAERLVDSRSEELEHEFDRLERKAKQLAGSQKLIGERLSQNAEQVQKQLVLCVPAVRRLITAWIEHVAVGQANMFREHIAAARTAEAEPLCQQLAMLSTTYLDAKERWRPPSESWTWSQPLRPLPSQKLDTGLLQDPLFKPVDTRQTIRNILTTANELVKIWSELLAELEPAKNFVAPAFREEAKPPPDYASWNEPLVEQNLENYIAAAAEAVGKQVSQLTEVELRILQSEWQQSRLSGGE